MEKRGEILFRRIGSRTLVPMSEIERILTDTPHPAEVTLQALRDLLLNPDFFASDGQEVLMAMTILRATDPDRKATDKK